MNKSRNMQKYLHTTNMAKSIFERFSCDGLILLRVRQAAIHMKCAVICEWFRCVLWAIKSDAAHSDVNSHSHMGAKISALTAAQSAYGHVYLFHGPKICGVIIHASMCDASFLLVFFSTNYWNKWKSPHCSDNHTFSNNRQTIDFSTVNTITACQSTHLTLLARRLKCGTSTRFNGDYMEECLHSRISIAKALTS